MSYLSKGYTMFLGHPDIHKKNNFLDFIILSLVKSMFELAGAAMERLLGVYGVFLFAVG
jgi:hypothetical protein